MSRLRAACAGALLLLTCLAAQAAIDIYAFETPEQEARFKALSDELRCPKCLNTNLSGSDSPIASDLRRTVARMVVEGHSDEEIRSYLLERYGDFILYRPRLTARTFLLWFGPAFLLAGGAFVVWRMARAMPAAAAGDGGLSEDEQAQLAALGVGDDPDDALLGDAGPGGSGAR